MRLKFNVVLLIFTLSAMQSPAYAADNMMLKGTLIGGASCTVNNDQRIDIDFGSRLGISQIDGTNYRQNINYQITCASGITTPDMMMTITATSMTGDATAIQSDKSNLGIRLLQNGTPIVLNQALTFFAANPPILEAVPVTNDKTLLTEGVFTALAAIQVEYQ